MKMPEEKADKKKVFISYGHDNCKDLAFLLNDRLKEKGYEPWIDEHKTKSGYDWEIFMENGLIESDAILSLMTPYSMRRPDGYCLNELTLANILHKTIIPIMVRYIIPPLSIVRLQYLDFQEWRCSDDIFKTKFEKILEVVDGKELGFEGEYSYLLKNLRPIDFGAEIDKHTRKFYGRKWIFQEVNNWLYGKDDKESKIFLLKGDPGIGKTAIASKICREFSEVAAYHLIEYGNSIKSDAKECVLSLAYQLSNQIPDLVNSLRADGLKFLDKENALSLFDRLIVQPLRNISEPEKPKLIVIDALDEAKKEKRSGKGMTNEMLDFIVKIFELTPKWLKLFITSRPEQYILNKLDELEPFSLDTRDERNDEDIRGFLKKELNKIFPNLPIENAIETIVERSEGIFLYIIKILEDLRRYPEQGILKIKNPEMFPKGLTKWYLENFERQFPDEENYEKNLVPFLELIVAAQEPLKLSLIQDILGWDRYQLNKALQALGTLFKITADEEIETFHKTLVEWLNNEKATQTADRTFFIDEISGGKKLANFGWNLYRQDPSLLPFYFFRHLIHHLSETNKIDELNNLKAEINIEVEKTNISEISSQFIQHLTQYFKKGKREDILAEFLLDSKKVSCPTCKSLNLDFLKGLNLYKCLNPKCEQEPFDTKIHSKFKNVFLSYSSDEIHIDLIEKVKKDLIDDYISIQKKMGEAQVIIIVMSPHTLKNEKCLNNIENARKHKKQIIVMSIEDCIPPVGSILRQITPLDFQNSPFTDLEYNAKLNQLKHKIEEEIIIYEAKRLKHIYISHESGVKLEPAEFRVIGELDTALKMSGVSSFIPDGLTSHEIRINNLKTSDFAFCLIFPHYGSLMNECSLKDDCKAVCPMKTGESRISYIHCEYKTIIAEGILHQTYMINEDWDIIPVDARKQASEFKGEIGAEFLGFIDIEDPNIIQLICSNLAKKIFEWYTMEEMDFPNFYGRKYDLIELIENIDNKVEIVGVAGIGKTTLIQVALLLLKLKGREIISIGIGESYGIGSGFDYFKFKVGRSGDSGYDLFHEFCFDSLFQTESNSEITLYDIYNALANIMPKIDELKSKEKEEITDVLSRFINNRKNLILFIDDFHLATDDVHQLVRLLNRVIIASRKNTNLTRKSLRLTGLEAEFREDFINSMSEDIGIDVPDDVKETISQITEGLPLTMQLLMRNYQVLDFDKIKDLSADADDNQVKDFYERVLEEIFSDKPHALNLLKNISILNTDLQTNINRESVLNSYNIEHSRKAFKTLIDTGMLKKREGKEGVYEFFPEHIQSAPKSLVDQASHENAIKYYQKKIEIFGDNIDDSKEIEYHRSKLNSEDI